MPTPADGEVFVIDRVLTRPGCARRFIDTYLAEYAPGARDRGMTLRDVLVSPPIWFDDDVNTVTITWTLPNVRAWWDMTWKGRRRSPPSAAATAFTSASTVSGSVTPARSGGSGTWVILGPKLSTTEGSPVSWASTATSTPGSA
jgi:hypothetical protein